MVLQDDLVMGSTGLEAIPCNFDLHELPPDCQHSILIHAHRAGVLNLRELGEAAKNQHASTFTRIMSEHKEDNRVRISSKGLLQTHQDKDKFVHHELNQRFRERKALLLEKHHKISSLPSEERQTLRNKAAEAAHDECRAAWSYITFFENRAQKLSM